MNSTAMPRTATNLEMVNCPNCGAAEHALLFEIEDYLYAIDGRFAERCCADCGLVYLSPRPTRAAISRYYPPTYAPYRPAIQDEHSALMRWMRRRKLVNRRRAVEQLAYQRPGDLLDVGCSTGIFMDEMRAAGWSVTGVEMVHEAAQYAHGRFGLDVIEGDLLEVGLAAQSFDTITLFDVLEHTFEPAAVLRRAYELLRPGGIVALTLPNWESLDRRLFGKYWVGFDAPRHLSVFPHGVLVKILEGSGFTVVDDRCLFGGYFTFVTSLRTWLRGHSRSIAGPLETIIDIPGIRLPFEPFFMLLDRIGAGGIRFIVAGKLGAYADQRSKP